MYLFPKMCTKPVLTAYAVETRYPGDYEPVNEDDYLYAVTLARQVLNWAEKRLPESAMTPG
jgi:hypothetical protein